uniref:Uncharacterized protein ycf20 n=1 Tax=Gracilaria vermiculophylla TaxID=2608709 RepID=A0A345U8V5_9FLOR|nr:hypothetical protein [Gracilaria vermiculophylla]AXI96891.1 hypothetical protein [Gracilaria vermiculophylla]QXU75104.1 hypothetical protein [Gracilaria vermiculophylla]WDZ68029.1 hypothetical protein [Gracilaria vermiculophylla]
MLQKSLNSVIIQLISLFLGFFLSTVFSTIPSQTGDWGIVTASFIVTINEIISKNIYKYIKTKYTLLSIRILNYTRIGIVYGLFVDAFKLGS